MCIIAIIFQPGNDSCQVGYAPDFCQSKCIRTLVVIHISTMRVFFNIYFGLKPLLNLVLMAYLNLFQIKFCPKFYCLNFGFLVAGVHICRAFFLQFYDISLQNDIRTPRASIEETFSHNLINSFPVFRNAGSPR